MAVDRITGEVARIGFVIAHTKVGLCPQPRDQRQGKAFIEVTR